VINTILFVIAGAMVLFCMGVLVGSGLHTEVSTGSIGAWLCSSKTSMSRKW
jgi:hypothetical protein